MSPAEIMFNRQMKVDGRKVLLDESKSAHNNIIVQAKELIKKKNLKNKKYYDKRRSKRHFEMGDIVFLELHLRWHPPYNFVVFEKIFNLFIFTKINRKFYVVFKDVFDFCVSLIVFEI